MTPDQLALVAATVAELEACTDEFASGFYARLFVVAPEIRILFPDEVSTQRRKLAHEVFFLATAVGDLPTFTARARDLGARHHRYGVRPGHYEAMEQALLGALGDVLGPAWTRATMRAWQRLYRLLVETMLEGSAGAAFAGPAA
jgi:nitric oxide dioxygenase